MTFISYIDKRFSESSVNIIEHANQIIDEYINAGYLLTLRQLYYQFVARDLLANTTQSYKRLGSIINDGRLAGMISWDAIEDRTRATQSNAHWNDPSELVRACADQFQIDKWQDQPYRPEVWIEKEALAGVIEPICKKLDISYLSCRGYTSQSEMWKSGQRLIAMATSGQIPVILHFGDHDPSGIDMTRDIIDRLEMFTAIDLDLRRLALNMDQVRKYNPPPNPAKVTDTRFNGYVIDYGHESWELDALEPAVLSGLVESEVIALRDENVFMEAQTLEDKHRELLSEIADDINHREEY
jgi:hypothetical protein